MDALIIFGAKYLIAVVVAVGLAYLFVFHPWRRAALLALGSFVVAFVVGKGLGLLWYDPLPFVVGNFTPLVAHAANNGFPSDHVLLAATTASIVCVYNRTMGAVLWGLAILIGVSRVAAGVHHPIDVISAALIAIVATAAVEYGIRCSRFN